MKSRLLTFFVIMATSLLINAQTQMTEEQVNQQIQQARNNAEAARMTVQQAEAALQQYAGELNQLKQSWNKIQDDIVFLQQKLESAGNSLAVSVSHQDNELKRYKQKLQRLLSQGGSAEEIDETRRYITAYENWKASRLKKNGLTAWKAAIERQLAGKQAELDDLRPGLQSAINNTKAAEQKLNEARLKLQESEEKLLNALLEAPLQLMHINPPYLKKVVVMNGGSTRYAAEWDDYTKLIDEQIKILRKGIEEQKSIIEAQKKLVQVAGDELLIQNRLTQEKLDAYVDEIQGWGVTKVIMADLLDAGLNIARNFKQMGPYAFAFEAAYRLGELGLWATGTTGAVNEDWDVTKLSTQPNAPVDITSTLSGYGIANLKDQIKGQVLNILKSYIGANEFGIPGKEISFASFPERSGGNFSSLKGLKEKWGNFRQLINEGKFWVLADEALNWKHPAFPDAMDMFSTLKRNPGLFLQNLKSSFNRDMMKGALLDVVQTSFIQYLKNWANDTRLKKWSDYLVEDIKREELTGILKAAGNKLRYQQTTLDALNDAMRELIRQKEEQSQKATRYLKPLKDEVLSGSGNFILLLEFSAPVTTDSVVLGGKRIDGKSKGNTWSGSFNLTGMQGDNQAKLIVAAKGTTTQKELDDPVTEAKYRSSNQRWTGYERTTDRYHKIKLKALRSGTSILLLVDCSGSMGDNGRMAKAKAAAEKVLSSAQFEPTDEVALMAFYDCGDVRVLQAFTNDLAEVKTKLNLLSPSGYTPLSSSIIAASYYLESTARTPYRKMIVLTDGQESCNGNEFETMQRIKKFHQDIKKIIL